MPGDGEQGVPVLVYEVFVFDLPRHHHQALDHRGHGVRVEALVVREQDAETKQRNKCFGLIK